VDPKKAQKKAQKSKTQITCIQLQRGSTKGPHKSPIDITATAKKVKPKQRPTEKELHVKKPPETDLDITQT